MRSDLRPRVCCVQLLHSPSDDVREQAVWALGNIAGDSPDCRNLVLGAGALAPLLGQARGKGFGGRLHVVGCLRSHSRSLARSHP